MKRIISFVLLIITAAVLFTACGDSGSGKTEETTAVKTDAELSSFIDSKLEDLKYDGVIYLTHNGNIVYQRATGTDENGDPLTIDTSMYIGCHRKLY